MKPNNQKDPYFDLNLCNIINTLKVFRYIIFSLNVGASFKPMIPILLLGKITNLYI